MKVAYAFLFLMSYAASWITGINLTLCSLKFQSLWSTTAACMRARCQADARLPPGDLKIKASLLKKTRP